MPTASNPADRPPAQADLGFWMWTGDHYAVTPSQRRRPSMRILLATSFPVPGEYDGTAMLPIKILRALKRRGVEVVLAHLKARPPFGASSRDDFEGTPSFTFHPHEWVSGLKRVHREFPFDLVHAQHHGGANRASFACRRYGWPLVYELHSLLGAEG